MCFDNVLYVSPKKKFTSNACFIQAIMERASGALCYEEAVAQWRACEAAPM